jgi:hypothetical protein
VATYFLKKSKQKARASRPKIGDLNFLNAEEKTPSKNQRFFSVPSCRLSA